VDPGLGFGALQGENRDANFSGMEAAFCRLYYMNIVSIQDGTANILHNPAENVRMTPMVRRPQQQTLSIRVSEALRDFLERSKQVIAVGRGESVSTSDVAKILLESAKDDRLDFRLEAAELQRSPSESLWSIRRKWEQKLDLTRAEWIFLAQYVQVACEELSQNPETPSADSFAVLLEALRAIRDLRIERGIGLDRFYLENLGSLEGDSFLNDRQLDPDIVPRVIDKWIQQLRSSPKAARPAFAGRAFYVAIRDERFSDLVAVNRALSCYLDTLYRLAARGHWIKEHRPVRGATNPAILSDIVTPVSSGNLRISIAITSEGDLSILLRIVDRDLMYPVATYPEIREFITMLDRFKQNQVWRGTTFYAFTAQEKESDPARIYFRRSSDGVTLGFSLEEWHTMKNLFAKLFRTPSMQRLSAELSLVYGEF
jgi:hypothetical protein